MADPASNTAAQKAERLRALHYGPDLLLLPNAWDCASARIFETQQFPAIATTSGGMAFALGYADGQQIPAGEMIAAVRRIARCVSVPVTADVESGYTDVAATTADLIAAGVAGLNLEDAADKQGELVPLAEQLEKIRTVRRIGAEAGVPLVINARTEIFLARVGDPASRLDRTCERLHAFREAGADCLFVPGVADEETIGRLVAEVGFPLNILAVAGTPPLARLRELGVARVSVGSGIMRAAMGLTARIAQELQQQGTYGAMLSGAIPYPDMNRLFEPSR